MSEREILVADSDNEVRRQMAERFREAGYQVETTDSAVHVFCTVLEKQIPVVLLGSGCDKKIALADLVPLLKKCNRGVTIILVSDEESLPVVRSIRQEGIFYHALTPNSREETEEIFTAVECAFKRGDAKHGDRQDHAAAGREASPAHADREAAVVMAQPAPVSVLEAAPAHSPRAFRQGREKNMKGKVTAVAAALIAAIAGAVYCVMAVTKGMKGTGDLVIWGFLGFCSLIIVGQLIPAFFSFMAARKVAEKRLQEELANKNMQKEAVFDRTE